MDIVRAIFSNFTAFLLSAIMTMLPTAGIKEPVVKTIRDDCLLNIEMISDTHLETTEILRPLFLMKGLSNLKDAKSNIDGIVVCGDITNYGDTKSVDKFFDIYKKYSPVQELVFVSGNHDIGHVEDRDHDEARQYLIDSFNSYGGTEYDKIYYSKEINGYKFIVLSDEGDRWDHLTMSEEQLAFLDRELAEGTKDGKPVFVCCHWPVDGTNGEDTIWDGSGVYLDEWDVKSICEKYSNVFWISGHMHSGIKSTWIAEKFGLSNAEQINGVTYLNLPTYGIVNMFGVPWSGTGAQLEVYENEVVFRPRNFLTNAWYANAEFHFDLQK